MNQKLRKDKKQVVGMQQNYHLPEKGKKKKNKGMQQNY